jgi:hypothetical protein
MADEKVQPAQAPAEPVDGQTVAPLASGDEPAEAAAAAPSAPVPRSLKLVVSCAPHQGGYRAALALGAEGCDPLFHAVVADGLVAALDEVPALLAEAEARWREQPRYPSAKGRPSTARAAAPARPTAGAPPATPAARPSTAPPTKPPPAGQMGLFG